MAALHFYAELGEWKEQWPFMKGSTILTIHSFSFLGRAGMVYREVGMRIGFSPVHFRQYSLRSGSLTGVATSDSWHVERLEQGPLVAIYRDLSDPLGTIGTTKYAGYLISIPPHSPIVAQRNLFWPEARGRAKERLHGRHEFGGGEFRAH